MQHFLIVIALQAFYLARTGRPGPVLIDVPKDVQQQMAVPDWDVPMAIAGYMGRLPPPPTPKDLAPVLQALREVRLFPIHSGQSLQLWLAAWRHLDVRCPSARPSYSPVST